MLLADCTHLLAGTHYTGIQRYVRHTLRHASALLGPGGAGVLRATSDGQWQVLDTLPAHPMEGLGALDLACTQGPAHFSADTHVLLADRFWHTGAWAALDVLLQSPARITLVVYDLLSLRQPQWFASGTGERFARYLRAVLPRAQQVVCLSNVVQADLARWCVEQRLHCGPVSVVAPGHRIWSGAEAAPPLLPRSWRDGTQRFVLQVGTIEPRKNHALTLAALRKLWDDGTRVGALFIGQRGWLMDAFIDEMAGLPQWQRELLWLQGCTDAQLAWCLRHAACMVYPSAGEGYGLPLAEAASMYTPVVASDTPVHREVAAQFGGSGKAVRLCALSADEFAGAIESALVQGRQMHTHKAVRGWDEATAALLQRTGSHQAV